MSYESLRDHINSDDGYRRKRDDALLNTGRRRWFTSSAADLAGVIELADSTDENDAIKSGYSTDTRSTRIRDHIKLDYVCGIRKDIRSQFFSCGNDVFTDVSPYRVALVRARSARMFDSIMDSILQASEEQGDEE